MTALRSLRVIPSATFSAPFRPASRRYAHQIPAKGQNTSSRQIGLIAAAFAGIGAYTLMTTSASADAEKKVKDLAAEKQAGNQAPGAFGALIKDTWTPFTLARVEDYNHNTKIYHFDFPEDAKDKVSGITVAGALLVKTPEGEEEVKDAKGKPVIRPYTPISPPEETGALTLLIKEYKDGKLTPYISNLAIGQPLLFKGPIVKYAYKPDTFDQGLCIAGGSGITPMWQLVKYSLEQPEDKTKWTLIFSNVSEKDILMRKEWDALASKHGDRLTVNYVVDKGSWSWRGETGFVTASTISKLFPRQDGQSVKAFVCGPPPQVKSISGPKDGPRQGELSGALKELGYTSDEVFKF